MSNYSKEPEFLINDNNIEIISKEVIPINDLNIISKVVKNRNPHIYELETSNKEQFENIKSVFGEHITCDEYRKILGEIDDLISKGIERGDIFKKDSLNNIDIMDIMHTFFQSIIELIIDNKVIDGIYEYANIDNDVIDDIIIFPMNDEYRKYFITEYAIFKMISYNTMPPVYAAFNAYKTILSDKYKKSRKYKRTYVMKDSTGYYKIGKSIDPIFRQHQFKTGNITIDLCFYIEGDRESELHHIFEHKKVEREWYNLNNKDLKFIRNYNNIRKNHPEYIINKRL